MIIRVPLAAYAATCVVTCALVLTACSGSSPIIPQSNPPMQSIGSASAPQKPSANGLPLPQTSAQGSWIDWPITQGSWVYRADARGSIALFGQEQRDAVVTIRCDRTQNRIYLSFIDQAEEGAITIRTSSALKTINASSPGSNAAYIAAEIMPDDPILDAIIYTRGRFALQGSGGQSIAIPVYAEIAKVVEDCRA